MKLDNILKYIIFGAIFLVPFLPFLVTGSLFFPFIAGKGFAFRILVELMLGAWAILAIRNPEYRIKFSKITILVTVFVVIIGLADILGAFPLKSIWSNFERMEGWVLLIHLFGFFIATTSVMNVKEIWHRFFNVSIFASIIMGGYGLLQLAGKLEIHQGSTRLDASFGNSAYFAVYLLFHIFLAIFFLLKSESGSLRKWFYGAVILLETVILYNTATRGAILGLIGGLMITTLFVALFEKENKKIRKVCIGLLVGLIAFVGLFVAFKESSVIKNSPVLNRFASISLQETTTKSRFMVWSMAWEGFKEKPILGWGQENFNYVFNENYNPKMYGQEEWFDRTHNVFFDWLIAGGLLGLLGYLSLFFILINYIIKDKNNFSVSEKGVLIGMLAGYFIHNLFVFDNLMSYVMFFSILGYIHTLNKDEKKLGKEFNITTQNISISIILILTIFSLYFFNGKGILAGNNLLKALSPQEQGINQNIEYYKKALSYNSFVNQEIREQLSMLASKTVYSNLDSEKKQFIINFSANEMNKQIEIDPNNARLYVMQGSLFANAGSYDEALVNYKKALELSPRKQSILILITSVYLNKGNYTEALNYAKRTYKLSPEYNDIRLLYASAAVYNKENELADEILVSVFGTNLVDDDNLVQAYLKTNQHNKVIAILTDRVERDPKNYQNHLALASVFFDAGYTQKAIDGIQYVIDMNPDFKGQGEYYISEIKAGRQP